MISAIHYAIRTEKEFWPILQVITEVFVGPKDNERMRSMLEGILSLLLPLDSVKGKHSLEGMLACSPLSKCYKVRGEFQKAKEILLIEKQICEESISLSAKSKEDFQEAIEESKTELDFFSNTLGSDKAEYYLAKLNTHERPAELDKEAATPKDEALHLVQEGLWKIKQGEWEEARVDIEKAQKIFVEIGDKINEMGMYEHIGRIEAVQGNYQKAETHFKGLAKYLDVLGEKERLPKIYSSLARLKMSQKDYKGAKEYYQMALAAAIKYGSEFDQSDIYNGLGFLAMEIGELDQAADYFEKGNHLYGNMNLGLGKWHFHFQMGRIEQQKSNWKEAERHWLLCMEVLEDLKQHGKGN